MENNETLECRICGQTTTYLYLDHAVNEDYQLVRCHMCGTVHTLRVPTSELVADTYNMLFNDGDYKGHRAEHAILLHAGRIHRPFQKKLLYKIGTYISGRDMIEIGGGTGAFGIMATSAGWRYSDYDVSEEAVSATRALGLAAKTFDIDFGPKLPTHAADVIVMWEVLEHIGPVHNYLKLIIPALKPGGLLVLSTPNVARKGYLSSLRYPGLSSPPIHLNFFSHTSLRAALVAAGFSRVDFIRRRFYRPQPSMQSVWRHIKIALGLEATKTLYAFAQL